MFVTDRKDGQNYKQLNNPLNVAANEIPVPSVAVVCHEKDLTCVTPQHRELDLNQLLPHFN